MFDTFTLITETMEDFITELKPDYNIHRRSVIMSIVVNSIPLVPYLIFMAGLFFGFIYSIYDVKKRTPGHPMIWIFPFGMLLCLSCFLNRYALEATVNDLFQQITDIAVHISVAGFALSFLITFIFAYKKNYVKKEKLKKLAPLLIGCIIIMLICFIIPLLLKK